MEEGGRVSADKATDLPGFPGLLAPLAKTGDWNKMERRAMNGIPPLPWWSSGL